MKSRKNAYRSQLSSLVMPCAALALMAFASIGPGWAFAEERYVIGFSQCTVKEPWRVEFNRRLVDHAKKNHPDVRLEVLDANDKTEVQVAQMRTFIRRGVDAILVSPKEAPGLTGVVKEAVEAGIPVVVLDRDVNFKGYNCFVGSDNKVIGRAAGMYIVNLLGGPGKAEGVVYEICGGLASTPGQERRAGFHELIDKEKGIEVLGGLDADWKKDVAQTLFAAALKAHERIDVVYAHNDPMGHGAYLAAKSADRQNEIKIVGIDSLPDEGIRWVKTGELAATVAYPTPGEKGLDVAVDILNGKEVPRRITLPTRIYTKANVDSGGEQVDVAPDKPTKPGADDGEE